MPLIYDEWNDVVSQALLEHQESPDPAVSILERMDPFKANMEIQDIFQPGSALNILTVFFSK